MYERGARISWKVEMGGSFMGLRNLIEIVIEEFTNSWGKSYEAIFHTKFYICCSHLLCMLSPRLPVEAIAIALPRPDAS